MSSASLSLGAAVAPGQGFGRLTASIGVTAVAGDDDRKPHPARPACRPIQTGPDDKRHWTNGLRHRVSCSHAARRLAPRRFDRAFLLPSRQLWNAPGRHTAVPLRARHASEPGVTPSDCALAFSFKQAVENDRAGNAEIASCQAEPRGNNLSQIRKPGFHRSSGPIDYRLPRREPLMVGAIALQRRNKVGSKPPFPRFLPEQYARLDEWVEAQPSS